MVGVIFSVLTNSKNSTIIQFTNPEFRTFEDSLMHSHPSEYHPDLIEERLQFVASKIMEQVHLTYETNSATYDDVWTQGCVIFGRVKNLLIDLARFSGPQWLGLVKEGMDVTPTIGKVPFRFATDNPEAPKKQKILAQNQAEFSQFELAFESADDFLYSQEVSKWRWYIKKAHSEEDIPSVHFVGLDCFDTPVCTWKFDETVPQLHSVDGHTPKAKPISEAPVHVPAAKISLKQPK